MIGEKRARGICFVGGLIVALLAPLTILAQYAAGVDAKQARFAQVGWQVPDQLLSKSIPGIACWFWTEEEFQSNGHKAFINAYERHSAVGLITASLRCPGELTDPVVYDKIKTAATYAQQKGMGLVMDLDVRLARKEFVKRFPNELQELVLIREFGSDESGLASLEVDLPVFNDHYTHGRDPFEPVGSRVLAVYSYEKAGEVIKKGSIKNVTSRSSSASTSDSHTVTIKPKSSDKGRTYCALIAVALSTPDVFSPHLLPYQRQIIQQYQNSGLVGAAKDEWGFPGRVDPPTTDLWFSDAMAQAYGKQYQNRDLTSDLLLMAIGIQGREVERAVAINHYMAINYRRNAEIETDFYHAVKAAFGAESFVGTHPTWFPYPNSSEMFKNGLSWWSAKRDIAQTDESTPYSVRTALSKKWHSPVWYDMFYSSAIPRYSTEIWRAVLGGGRLNIHQPFPVEQSIAEAATLLLQGDLFSAIQRIQLLDYVSSAPVNSPVAVVFGHPAAMNWANPATFNDVGLAIANKLWENGVYADLIPSSEIVNGSLQIGANGKLRYGLQEYEAVVYYHPEYDYVEAGSFFDQLTSTSPTSLFVIGESQLDFNGKRVDKPFSSYSSSDSTQVIANVLALLQARGHQVQTTGEMLALGDFPPSVVPHASGHIRLVDSTYIFASGEKHLMGDPIKMDVKIAGKMVSVDAEGVVAVRFDQHGQLAALAAGGLKSFAAGDIHINLPERIDVALIKENGVWRGIVHGADGVLPPALTTLTTNWTMVKIPAPVTD